MVYIYTTEQEEVRHFEWLPKTLFFKSEFVTIVNSTVYVKKGYSWNGCSPKWRLGKKVIGTPEDKNGATKYASLWHDVFYQYSQELQRLYIKITGHIDLRYHVDFQFYTDLQEKGFKFAGVYYEAVNLFGGFAWSKIINNRKNG